MELRRVPKWIRAMLEERGCYPLTKAPANQYEKPSVLSPGHVEDEIDGDG